MRLCVMYGAASTIKDGRLLKEKLIKIGAKVVVHARYVTFQMAEVAINSDLFADVLQASRLTVGKNGVNPPI
jgi:hypothetical protein